MSRPLNPWKLSGYKPGQNVICRVQWTEPGGYAVIIPKDGLPGFLPTTAILRPNEEILAQFVCVHNNRILLSARFSNTSVSIKSPAHQSVNWQDHLDGTPPDAEAQPAEEYAPQPQSQPPQIEAQPQGQYIQTPPPPAPSPQYIQPQQPHAPSPQLIQPAQQNALITPPAQPLNQSNGGTRILTTHVQTPFGQTDEERAFDVWAQSQPRQFHLKRATDLILPPLVADTENKFKIADYDLEWLITDLEGGMRTGCVKASSEARLSRSAMLLYKGRAVGCIYGCKSMPETQPTEQSLQLMLNDLELPDTNVRMYDLPESVTLAMSALFLGYPVQRNDEHNALGYMNYICGWFENKSQTACLAITLPASAATCLGFIYKGQFCGAFYVEDQKFTEDVKFVHELLTNDPKANIEASILPPEMTSAAVRFGFSLSMARQRNKMNEGG